jgi:hypothetical protein
MVVVAPLLFPTLAETKEEGDDRLRRQRATRTQRRPR